MPNIPTPLRAALGLAATAVDEARKLPETLPQAVTTVPMIAVSTAMQASMKVQQHIAMLAARGDEVLSQLRGNSSEPPSWATFDDAVADGNSSEYAAEDQSGKAAFDLIDYDNTGFAEGDEGDEGKGRWDAVGVGGTETEASQTLESGITDPEPGVSATPPVAAGPTAAAPDLADAVSAPGLDTSGIDRLGIDPPDGLFPPDTAGQSGRSGDSTGEAGFGDADGSAAPVKATRPRKAGPAKAGPAKAGPAKTGPAKTGPAKSGPAKTGPAKTGPAKAEPAKAEPAKAEPAKAAKAGPAKAPAKAAKAAKAPAKRAGRKAPDHEPLEQAAMKAKPSATPNPSTMAAEIVQAHEVANDDE
jgi:hypothetical protein